MFFAIKCAVANSLQLLGGRFFATRGHRFDDELFNCVHVLVYLVHPSGCSFVVAAAVHIRTVILLDGVRAT